jgi:hypothetical protein
MNNGTKGGYECRDCKKRRDASVMETSPSMLGRVVCWWCGGTCDPTAQTKSRIDAGRRQQSSQQARNVKLAGGLYESEKQNMPKGD